MIAFRQLAKANKVKWLASFTYNPFTPLHLIEQDTNLIGELDSIFQFTSGQPLGMISKIVENGVALPNHGVKSTQFLAFFAQVHFKPFPHFWRRIALNHGVVIIYDTVRIVLSIQASKLFCEFIAPTRSAVICKSACISLVVVTSPRREVKPELRVDLAHLGFFALPEHYFPALLNQ